MKNLTKVQSGFTLVEIMIALAIVAILSAIAIPAYNGYITTARMSEAHNNLAAIRLAQEEFFLENNRYFTGNGYVELESNSGNLWKRTAGSEGVSFTYVVSSTDVNSTWSAMATGNSGSVSGKTATATK